MLQQTLLPKVQAKIQEIYYQNCRIYATSITQEKDSTLGNLFDFIPFKWNKNREIIPICTTGKKNFGLEQKLEKKMNDVNSFRKSNFNIKELITYSKDKNHKSKKKYQKNIKC